MAEVLLFHHVLGLTDGVEAFADDLRRAGHAVHVPDLYGGLTFATIAEGFEFQKSLDGDTLADRAASELPEAVVHMGIS